MKRGSIVCIACAFPPKLLKMIQILSGSSLKLVALMGKIGLKISTNTLERRIKIPVFQGGKLFFK